MSVQKSLICVQVLVHVSTLLEVTTVTVSVDITKMNQDIA